jgi:hypothetical protein
MQKSFRLILCASIIGLGLWGWRTWFPTPEEIIRSRLRKLAAIASFEPQQGMVSRTYYAQKIVGFFTPDVVIDFDSRGYEAMTINGRDELQQKVLAATRFVGVKVEFLDVNITFGPDKQTAIANLTGKATVEGQRDFFVQEFNFILKKADGQWLIWRVESVKTLSQANSSSPPFAGAGSACGAS